MFPEPIRAKVGQGQKAVSLNEGFSVASSLPQNEQPLSREDAIVVAQMGGDPAKVKTIGDKNKLQKQEPNISKVAPSELNISRDLVRLINDAEFLSTDSNGGLLSEFIGPLQGGSYYYTSGFTDHFNGETEKYIPQAELQSIVENNNKEGNNYKSSIPNFVQYDASGQPVTDGQGNVLLKFKQSDLNATVASATNVVSRLRFGASQTATELVRLVQEIPAIYNTDDNYTSRFRVTKQGLLNINKGLEDLSGNKTTTINSTNPVNPAVPIQNQFDLQGNQSQTNFSGMSDEELMKIINE